MTYQMYQEGILTTVIGRLGFDLEVRQTKARDDGTPGKRYLQLSIAVPCGRAKNEVTGDWDQNTSWVKVTIWERSGGNAVDLMEFVANPPHENLVFNKGAQVILTASLYNKVETYTDKQGIERTSVVYECLHFYDLKKIPGTRKQEDELNLEMPSQTAKKKNDFSVSAGADDWGAGDTSVDGVPF